MAIIKTNPETQSNIQYARKNASGYIEFLNNGGDVVCSIKDESATPLELGLPYSVFYSNGKLQLKDSSSQTLSEVALDIPYSLSIDGQTLSLKNSSGTSLSDITIPSGGNDDFQLLHCELFPVQFSSSAWKEMQNGSAYKIVFLDGHISTSFQGGTGTYFTLGFSSKSGYKFSDKNRVFRLSLLQIDSAIGGSYYIKAASNSDRVNNFICYQAGSGNPTIKTKIILESSYQEKTAVGVLIEVYGEPLEEV